MAKYVDRRKIGSGGFGEVWEAIREEDGELFAKKVLIDESEEAEKRFQREVRLLRKLDHPRIIEIIGVRLRKKPYWYVMPLYKHSLYEKLPEIIGQNRI